jgi:uncharacterized protein (TIGR02145 family)
MAKMNLRQRSILLIIPVFLLIFAGSCSKEAVPDAVKTITDKDGNEYNTVTIGTQIWMLENLKTTRFNNGDLIGTTTPAGKNIYGETNPEYQWSYDGNESNADIYGRLYTWYAITDTRGVCPAGWHVPADSEWNTLTTYLGGEYLAGYKLMEMGNLHWINNGNANNGSGFTALAGGQRFYTGSYTGILTFGQWWSSSTDPVSGVWGLGREVHNWDAVCDPEPLSKNCGLSVRCVKN